MLLFWLVWLPGLYAYTCTCLVWASESKFSHIVKLYISAVCNRWIIMASLKEDEKIMQLTGQNRFSKVGWRLLFPTGFKLFLRIVPSKQNKSIDYTKMLLMCTWSSLACVHSFAVSSVKEGVLFAAMSLFRELETGSTRRSVFCRSLLIVEWSPSCCAGRVGPLCYLGVQPDHQGTHLPCCISRTVRQCPCWADVHHPWQWVQQVNDTVQWVALSTSETEQA